MREEMIETNGVHLHVVQAGPSDGPLVVLLHGFPEFWYGWRRQIEHLADRGYRVWVPDQRGYNTSDRPAEVRAYHLDELAADVFGLIHRAGCERASVVGHDWGAAVAWWMALMHPEPLRRIAVLNVPHPAVMQRALLTNLRQLARSWYIFSFQLPWLPEALLSRNDCDWPSRMLRSTSTAGAFTREDLDRYREAWKQPGALRGMLNWYRAAARYRPSPPAPRVTVPTLMIWGCHDVALGRELARPSIEYCEDGRLELLEEATHWVQHDEPERVNALLEDFLAGS